MKEPPCRICRSRSHTTKNCQDPKAIYCFEYNVNENHTCLPADCPFQHYCLVCAPTMSNPISAQHPSRECPKRFIRDPSQHSSRQRPEPCRDYNSKDGCIHMQLKGHCRFKHVCHACEESDHNILTCPAMYSLKPASGGRTNSGPDCIAYNSYKGCPKKEDLCKSQHRCSRCRRRHAAFECNISDDFFVNNDIGRRRNISSERRRKRSSSYSDNEKKPETEMYDTASSVFSLKPKNSILRERYNPENQRKPNIDKPDKYTEEPSSKRPKLSVGTSGKFCRWFNQAVGCYYGIKCFDIHECKRCGSQDHNAIECKLREACIKKYEKETKEDLRIEIKRRQSRPRKISRSRSRSRSASTSSRSRNRRRSRSRSRSRKRDYSRRRSRSRSRSPPPSRRKETRDIPSTRKIRPSPKSTSSSFDRQKYSDLTISIPSSKKPSKFPGVDNDHFSSDLTQKIHKKYLSPDNILSPAIYVIVYYNSPSKNPLVPIVQSSCLKSLLLYNSNLFSETYKLTSKSIALPGALSGIAVRECLNYLHGLPFRDVRQSSDVPCSLEDIYLAALYFGLDDILENPILEKVSSSTKNEILKFCQTLPLAVNLMDGVILTSVEQLPGPREFKMRNQVELDWGRTKVTVGRNSGIRVLS